MWLGIDFGTTSTRAAILKDGEAIPLALNGNSPIMPSVVFLDEKNNLLVGQEAENSKMIRPDRYQAEFKRNIGQSTPFLLGNRRFLPEDLVRSVLAKVKFRAEQLTGSKFDRAVITIPVSYTYSKKGLMHQAAIEAGFDKIILITEPEAAAYYHAWANRLTGATLQDGQTGLVFDFGGGTFDAVLIKKQGAQYVIVGEPDGLSECGGIDCDRTIYNHIRSKATPRLSALMDPQNMEMSALIARGEIGDKVKKLKHKLSDKTTAEIDDLIPGSLKDHYVLKRSEFNNMIDPFVKNCIQKCKDILQGAGMKWSDVSQVLMVGGSSRIPYVKECLEKATGLPVLLTEQPELAVCLGAAVWAENHRQVSMESNTIFSSDNFVKTITTFCHNSGFKCEEIDESTVFIIVKFNESELEFGIYIMRFDDTVEFWLPTHLQYADIDEVPHHLSSKFMIFGSMYKYYFWCICERWDKLIVSIMHNIEFAQMDIEIFKKVARAMALEYFKLLIDFDE